MRGPENMRGLIRFETRPLSLPAIHQLAAAQAWTSYTRCLGFHATITGFEVSNREKRLDFYSAASKQ